MPYLTDDKKTLINKGGFCRTSGELNYKITEAIKLYLNTQGISYATINDIVGALEGAKMEFYRRIAIPYENQKLKDNGDVYHDEAVRILKRDYLK